MWWAQSDHSAFSQVHEFSHEKAKRWVRWIVLASIIATIAFDAALLRARGDGIDVSVVLIIALHATAILALTGSVAGLTFLVRRKHPLRRRRFVILWAELIAIAWGVQTWHAFFRGGGAESAW